VDGRNSDNTKILNELGWAPPTALRDGMEVTAEWIEQQMRTHREAETTSRFAVAHQGGGCVDDQLNSFQKPYVCDHTIEPSRKWEFAGASFLCEAYTREC
jgi:hypothetical protein